MNNLAGLNEKQKEAVTTINGPLLILAGAGAGKTKTITHRILHLIKEGVAPEHILAVTFTNKAAREMKERVESLLREDNSLNRPVSMRTMPFVSTFHSLGVHILREQGHLLGLPRNFTIYDRADSIRVTKEGMKRLDVDKETFEPRKILSAISRQKGEGISFSQYEETAGNEYFKRIVARTWREYEKQLREEKALDFDDLLLKTVFLLNEYENVRRHYTNIWRYIHIDEYQDTNEVQYKLVKLLVGTNNNVCVVGDIDQNIYSWRGATIENILQFENQYPNTKITVLEENYRSTKTILDAANDIIVKNKNRKEKNLFTKKDGGEKISLYGAYDEEDEANFVVTKTEELIQREVSPNEIAVLYRANFQSRVLEEVFLYYDVPYQVLGTKFFERKEVKDVLSFLRAALNPESTADVKRVINVPPRGIGKVTMLKIAAGEKEKLSSAMKRKVGDFFALLEMIRASIENNKPSKTVKEAIQKTGLEERLKNGDDEDKERLLNIKELAALAVKYDHLKPLEGIEKLLEDAALATDQDALAKDSKSVKLMTVHASKGLEFDYVFITGLEEDLFPHALLSEENADAEEERRLFYVALTRARKKIFLSFASARTIFGSLTVNAPSEFISDISDAHIEEVGNEKKEGVKTIYLEE